MVLFLTDPGGDSPDVCLSSPSKCTLPVTPGEVSAKDLVLESGTRSCALFRSLEELAADNLTFWGAVGVAAAVVTTPSVLGEFLPNCTLLFSVPVTPSPWCNWLLVVAGKFLPTGENIPNP